jgi:hypothetical protein
VANQPPAAIAPPPAAPAAPTPEQADQSIGGRLQKPADEREPGNARSREERQTARPAAEPPETSLDSLGRTDAFRNERAAPAPSAAAETTAMRAAAALADGAVAIASADPQIRWRIRPGGVVERSSDSGATWTAQPTPSPMELTAGTSPAPAVCWIVGRAGTVLRTVDAGATWQRIAFPESIDLTAVSASTPLAASVTLADGRRFGTVDGGRTWTALP